MTDDTVSLDIELPIAVFGLDPLALIEEYRKEWDALDEERLKYRGYQPWERFAVFVNDVVVNRLSITTGLEEHSERVEDGWYDVDLKWTHEDAERLKHLLDPDSPAAMRRDPNVPSLFADDEGQ